MKGVGPQAGTLYLLETGVASTNGICYIIDVYYVWMKRRCDRFPLGLFHGSPWVIPGEIPGEIPGDSRRAVGTNVVWELAFGGGP